ncbi:MAG: T9SS type A sorting domain-containing protein [Bacteroidales bacterium]
MKQNYFLNSIVAILLFGCSTTAFANTGWFNDYVIINKDNAGANYYWLGANPNFGTELNSYDFGTIKSLVITGCDFKYWSDTQDRSGGAFYYKIMSADNTTEVIAPVEKIWTQKAIGGNDFQGTDTISINLTLGLAASTTYKLHVWAKSWGTGQGDIWLSNSSANYVATFTTDISTGIKPNLIESSVSVKNHVVLIKTQGNASIEIYTLSGKIIDTAIASGNYSKRLLLGSYIVKINGTSQKVVVK